MFSMIELFGVCCAVTPEYMVGSMVICVYTLQVNSSYL